MKIMQSIICLCGLLAAVFSRAAAAPQINQLEIEQFRFQRHGKESFERLVLQFRADKKGNKLPKIKVGMSEEKKNPVVSILNASLVGAIPESAINSAYLTKSHILGTTAIDSGLADEITISVGLKDTTAKVDAFWLENPSRLVLDVFSPTSPRAKGIAILESKEPVARPSGATNYVCYPSNAQVLGTLTSANIESLLKNEKRLASPFMVTLLSPAGPLLEVKTNDPVVCFLKSARIAAKIELKKSPIAAPTAETSDSVKTEPVAPAKAAPPLLVEPSANDERSTSVKEVQKDDRKPAEEENKEKK